MQIITRQVEGKPLTVTIEYPEMTESVRGLVKRIESLDVSFAVNFDGKQLRIALSDVYYLETVDRKVFLYTKRDVYLLGASMAEIELVLMLFALALIITVTNYFMDEYLLLPMIASYIVKYFVFTGIVMLFGFIAGWFFPSNFWMAFIYVGIVLILAYAIDAFRISRDIEYINNHIKNSGSAEDNAK